MEMEKADEDLQEALSTLLVMVKEAFEQTKQMKADFDVLKEEYAKLVASQILLEAEDEEETEDVEETDENMDESIEIIDDDIYGERFWVDTLNGKMPLVPNNVHKVTPEEVDELINRTTAMDEVLYKGYKKTRQRVNFSVLFFYRFYCIIIVYIKKQRIYYD